MNSRPIRHQVVTVFPMEKSAGKSASPLRGRWRIVEMDSWDREDVDLLEPGFIEFLRGRQGEFAFIAVHAWMDCRWVEYNGQPGVEFSWEGSDKGDTVSGRGWAAMVDEQTILGRIHFHGGKESGFPAKRYDRFAEKEY